MDKVALQVHEWVLTRHLYDQVFKPSKAETSITSLDFDDQGELLVTACDDETLQLYNCRDGTHTKTLFSKKYGAHLARFTHHSSSILYASTKVDGESTRLPHSSFKGKSGWCQR